MRRRISNRKRAVIITSSLVIFAVLLVFVVIKMTSYTQTLKEDFSSAQIVCTDLKIFSSGELSRVLSETDAITPSDVDLAEITAVPRELCLVNLEYIVFSNIDDEVNDISFEISTSEISEGNIHAFSDSVFKEKLNNSYHVEQTVLMDKSCLRESIFEKDLPCSFGGQFDYKFTYTVQGREKPDTVAFTTAKKI